jgi:hypothetical protein
MTVIQTQLPKFVQINWCGDGVPESKKGLFHSHSGTITQFLRGTHVVISARNEVRFIILDPVGMESNLNP